MVGEDLMMPFQEMLHKQYLQQHSIIGPRPEGRAEQRELARKFAHYLIREVYEYLDAMSFKHFLPLDEAPRETRILELIDVFKYLMSLMWLEDVQPAEIERLFLQKTEVVEERHRRKLVAQRVCGFDIDGVLAQGGEDYETDPEAFYESGGALRLEPFAGARDTLATLKAAEWSIVLVTARKVTRHARLEWETHQWLKEHSIPYDLILFGYDKEEVLAKSKIRLSFFVEDMAKHALDIAKSGIEVLLLRNKEAVHERVHYIDDISEVVDWATDQGDLRPVPSII